MKSTHAIIGREVVTCIFMCTYTACHTLSAIEFIDGRQHAACMLEKRKRAQRRKIMSKKNSQSTKAVKSTTSAKEEKTMSAKSTTETKSTKEPKTAKSVETFTEFLTMLEKRNVTIKHKTDRRITLDGVMFCKRKNRVRAYISSKYSSTLELTEYKGFAGYVEFPLSDEKTLDAVLNVKRLPKPEKTTANEKTA